MLWTSFSKWNVKYRRLRQAPQEGAYKIFHVRGLPVYISLLIKYKTFNKTLLCLLIQLTLQQKRKYSNQTPRFTIGTVLHSKYMVH